VGAWEDELGRFRIWAANIGAHQTGCSSLDFRLRDASHVRAQIMKLLESLLRKLQDTRVALAEDEDDVIRDLGEAKTEIQELQEGLATIIDCLFQMSMLVRKPAQHDLRLGSKDADVAAFEQYDYNHVRGKYPRADDALVKRLSNAIILRRKYLGYRQKKAMKLKQGIENLGLVAHDLQDVQEGGSVTEGTEISNTVTTPFQPDVAFNHKASDSEVSQGSYTPTSVLGGNITIPLAPESSLEGLPFECPYCFYVITVSGSRSWNKHVFQDLPPYICVAPTCLTPDKLYSTKHEWLQHSDIAHPEVISDHNAPQNGLASCPLCIEDVKRGKSYDRHLARHLEELALFILPRSDEDSEISIPGSKFGKGSSKINEDESTEMEHWPHGMTIVAAMRTRILGADHPDTISSETNLAHILVKGGHWFEAEELHEHILVKQENSLGRDHPSTLETVRVLGDVIFEGQSYGYAAKAESFYMRALTGYEKVYGSEHPSTLNVVQLLGDVRTKQNRLKEAERFYERAHTGYYKVYGSEHPSTLNIVQLLGNNFTRQGKLAEARAFYQRAFTGYVNVYGAKHPSPIDVTLCLGDISARQGKLVEAEMSYKWAFAESEKLYGPEHESTLKIFQLLRSNLLRQGKVAEANALHERVL
ncbi:hypothetical protein BDR22DRAFT_780021, partial [Usnea florida]